MRRFLLVLLALSCLFAMASSLQDHAATRALEEPRGKLRKAIMPMLMGVVLKASTLVPISLMLMTFMTLSALFAAKLALGLVAAVGTHSLWKTVDAGGSADGGGGDLNQLASTLPQTATRRRTVKHPFSYFFSQ